MHTTTKEGIFKLHHLVFNQFTTSMFDDMRKSRSPLLLSSSCHFSNYFFTFLGIACTNCNGIPSLKCSWHRKIVFHIIARLSFSWWGCINLLLTYFNAAGTYKNTIEITFYFSDQMIKSITVELENEWNVE